MISGLPKEVQSQQALKSFVQQQVQLQGVSPETGQKLTKLERDI